MFGTEDKTKTTEILEAYTESRRTGERLLLGRIDRMRAGGRQRIPYMDTILSCIGGGQTTAGVLGLARSRQVWRSMVDNVMRQSPGKASRNKCLVKMNKK